MQVPKKYAGWLEPEVDARPQEQRTGWSVEDEEQKSEHHTGWSVVDDDTSDHHRGWSMVEGDGEKPDHHTGWSIAEDEKPDHRTGWSIAEDEKPDQHSGWTMGAEEKPEGHRGWSMVEEANREPRFPHWHQQQAPKPVQGMAPPLKSNGKPPTHRTEPSFEDRVVAPNPYLRHRSNGQAGELQEQTEHSGWSFEAAAAPSTNRQGYTPGRQDNYLQASGRRLMRDAEEHGVHGGHRPAGLLSCLTGCWKSKRRDE